MKTLTFQFTIADDGEVEFTTSHDGVATGQMYACALIASRDRGRELAKAMKQRGKSEFEVDALFDRARDIAREYVGA